MRVSDVAPSKYLRPTYPPVNFRPSRNGACSCLPANLFWRSKTMEDLALAAGPEHRQPAALPPVSVARECTATLTDSRGVWALLTGSRRGVAGCRAAAAVPGVGGGRGQLGAPPQPRPGRPLRLPPGSGRPARPPARHLRPGVGCRCALTQRSRSQWTGRRRLSLILRLIVCWRLAQLAWMED